jgi:formate-dependent phosphoribosylglycinamide formyltransferase (GAR transformylase)
MSKNTTQSISAILDNIERIRNQAVSPEELQLASSKIVLPCLIQPLNPSLDAPAEIAKSSGEVAAMAEDYRKSDSQAHFLVRKFLPYDFEATTYAIFTKLGTKEESLCISQPIGTLRTGKSPHIGWQPLWNIDDHSRMSISPFSGYGAGLHRKEEPGRRDGWESEWNGRYVPSDIAKEVETKLKDYSTNTLRKLQEDSGSPLTGVMRFEYGVRLKTKDANNKPEVYLNNISPYANETSLLSLATQQPTIPACIVHTSLGLPVLKVTLTASAAIHTIQAQRQSGWSPAYFNLESASKEDGTFIQLFGKHRFSTSETVGLAFAIDSDVLKAREKALTCAHKVEEGIDYGS